MKSLDSLRLGQGGPIVSRLGMGCWAIGGHGWGTVRDEDSIRAVRCALENGVTFFDTADTYGLGKSETLLGEALGPDRAKVVIATKGGVRWDDSGRVWVDATPAHLRSAVEASLRRLGLDCIPLYYLHKPDHATPIQVSVAALAKLRQEGKIASIGVANLSPEQLRDALQVSPIAAVQVRMNILERTTGASFRGICAEQGVSMIVWGALADGLLTGKFDKEATFPPEDHRARMPQFSGEQFRRNLECVAAIKKVADAKGRPLSQFALRWVLDSTDSAYTLFGAKTQNQVTDNLGADDWSLSKEDLAVTDAIIAEYLLH